MSLRIDAPDGVPEVQAGDDLADLLLTALAGSRQEPLGDGDVVAVTSKVVSKAEGRLVAGDRGAALAAETDRVVARRGHTTIVRNRLGLTMAAAGIDASNVPAGQVLPLPRDPDASARALRARLSALTGRNVAVLVTDTAGRAWRDGQTDIAVGAAGLRVLVDHRGHVDAHGHQLAVTLPAAADEIAGATELVQGKLSGRPFAVVRGLGHLVLPAGDDGPGAVALVRGEDADLFGYGAREAVLRALVGDPASRRGFGAPASAEELAGLLRELLGADAAVTLEGETITVPAGDPRVPVLAFACGWQPADEPTSADRRRWRPGVP